MSSLESLAGNLGAPSSDEEKVVLILVGLIGSGKSTFAVALEQHFPHFRRCNQDDLGNRRLVENMARDSLGQGYSVCIDRTNFDASQRAHWIGIAHEFPGTSIWVIVFDTPYDVCASRLEERVNHPTIKTPEQAMSVLSRFSSDFRPPSADEGYDRIIYLNPSEFTSPVYSRTDISIILQRLRDSPLMEGPRGSFSLPSHSFRGSRSRGHFSHPYPRSPQESWGRGRSRGVNVSRGRSAGSGYASQSGLNSTRGAIRVGSSQEVDWAKDDRDKAGDVESSIPRGSSRNANHRNTDSDSRGWIF